MKKMIFTNLCGNLGNDLIKEIYKKAHNLDATEIVVTKAKYNRFAIVELYENNDCIALDYTVSL